MSDRPTHIPGSLWETACGDGLEWPNIFSDIEYLAEYTLALETALWWALFDAKYDHSSICSCDPHEDCDHREKKFEEANTYATEKFDDFIKERGDNKKLDLSKHEARV